MEFLHIHEEVILIHRDLLSRIALQLRDQVLLYRLFRVGLGVLNLGVFEFMRRWLGEPSPHTI